MKLLQLFSYCSLYFLQKFESLLNTGLGQGGIICGYVGWCIGINKCGDIIYNIDVGLCVIVEEIGANNQVVPSNGAPIVYYVIVVDVRIIP